jgi:DNA-binding response OmpR family regulator
VTVKRHQTILIVEDDEATNKLFDLYLRGSGYKTLLAKDGRSALDMAQAHKPALVVLDLMLPELHGEAVCRQLKSNPKTEHIKVLMVSIKSFPADQKPGVEAGADLFLRKPLEKDEFIAAIDRLLGNNF